MSPLAIERPTLDDYDWIGPLRQLAFPNVKQDEEEIERWLATELGVIHSRRDPDAWCVVEYYELSDGMGSVILPGQKATHIKELIPQHHDPDWTKTNLVPLLRETLIEAGEKWPRALDDPTWAMLEPELARIWDEILGGKLEPTPRGTLRIVYVPTLRETIDILV